MLAPNGHKNVIEWPTAAKLDAPCEPCDAIDALFQRLKALHGSARFGICRLPMYLVSVQALHIVQPSEDISPW